MRDEIERLHVRLQSKDDAPTDQEILDAVDNMVVITNCHWLRQAHQHRGAMDNAWARVLAEEEEDPPAE